MLTSQESLPTVRPTVTLPGIPLSPAQFREHRGCSANMRLPPLPGCLVTSVTPQSGRLETRPAGWALPEPCPRVACIGVAKSNRHRDLVQSGWVSENLRNCGYFFLLGSEWATLPAPHSLTPSRTKRHLWAGVHLHYTERWTAWTPIPHTGTGTQAPQFGSCCWSCTSQGSPKKQDQSVILRSVKGDLL